MEHNFEDVELAKGEGKKRPRKTRGDNYLLVGSGGALLAEGKGLDQNQILLMVAKGQADQS